MTATMATVLDSQSKSRLSLYLSLNGKLSLMTVLWNGAQVSFFFPCQQLSTRKLMERINQSMHQISLLFMNPKFLQFVFEFVIMMDTLLQTPSPRVLIVSLNRLLLCYFFWQRSKCVYVRFWLKLCFINKPVWQEACRWQHWVFSHFISTVGFQREWSGIVWAMSVAKKLADWR